MEQLTGIINVFPPEDKRRRKQTGERRLGERLGPSYHGHHLEVLHIRPFCCQQLLGDEVGSICWEPLQGHHKRRGGCNQLHKCLTVTLFRTDNLGPLLF